MRVILAAILFVASSGIIFASYTADKPLSVIVNDFDTTVRDTCQTRSAHGDRLLSYLSSGDGESNVAAHTPNKSTVKLLSYLSCGFLDS